MFGNAHDISNVRRRAGSVMILVMLAVAMATVLGLTFLASSTTVTDISQTLIHHAKARQIAESGLANAIKYIQVTPNWRDTRQAGLWFDRLPLFTGNTSVSAKFDSAALQQIQNSSFEQQVAQLATPFINPPMSGTIAGWLLQRTALVTTGPTVPTIGFAVSASSTQGQQQAFINFGATVNGSATFEQQLAISLLPNRTYDLSVDIKPTGFPALSSNIGFRVLVGGSVFASTATASTLQLPTDPSQVPTLPSQLPNPPEVASIVQFIQLNSGYSNRTLRFATNSSPPPGLISIQLFAASIGIAAGVSFDNIRLSIEPDALLLLTSTGRFDNASAIVQAAISTGIDTNGTVRANVVGWSDQ